MVDARSRRRTTTRSRPGRPASRRSGSGPGLWPELWSGRRSRRSRSGKRSRSGRSQLGVAAVVAVLGGAVLLDWLADHPVVLVVAVVALLVAVVGAAGLYVAWVRARRRREEHLTRSIEVADRLDGAGFERWVAGLLRRTGFGQVRVSGGAGDLGADVTARLPDGRLLVIQCKRYGPDKPVGSPDVQRFAGTARSVHEADVAAIVTTSRFTAPARSFATEQGISLVDRAALTRWAADGLLPVPLIRPGQRTGR